MFDLSVYYLFNSIIINKNHLYLSILAAYPDV